MSSPDGKLVAPASEDKTVRLPTWATLQTLEGHLNWVNSVVSSQNDKPVASASDKGFFDFLAASSSAYYSHQTAIAHISLQDKWIVETMRDLLWLPIDYLAEC